jgi:prevent-host-death family protein
MAQARGNGCTQSGRHCSLRCQASAARTARRYRATIAQDQFAHAAVAEARGRTAALQGHAWSTLLGTRSSDNLVSMTRTDAQTPTVSEKPLSSRWRLQDAKARFSELVRLAHSAGPQHVTLHGRDAVVAVDAAEFQRLQGHRTGQLLIDALRASPPVDIEIAPRHAAMPVRAVRL